MPEILAGRYTLRERIGAGGMGEVWRATDELLGRVVAVKLVLPDLADDAEFLRRFLAEARAMASVRHPGVVAIHDFGAAEVGGAYLVMEYVEGEPLSRVLGRVGRLDAAATMDIAAQAARALQAVHDRGIVHRDVKPANLMLRPDGSVALTDFGIAVGGGRTALTADGAILGTPSYLAPEQVLGRPATPRTDVYALGLVAYECLAGRRPFVGDNPFAVAMQRVHQPPPPLGPGVPTPVAAVVERALALDPDRRWPSAADLATAAQRAAGPAHGDATTVGWGDLDTVPRPRAARPPRRRVPVLAVVGGLVLVLALGAGGYAVWRADPGSSGPGPSATGPGPPAAREGRIPDGYVVCGEVLCPTEPMCWRGLVVISGEGRPPGRADCSDPHYWETFAAVNLPGDAVTDEDLTTLIERADVGEVCSAAAMAGRARDGVSTEGWRIEAWPIPADPYTVLVHCLAGSLEGETPGAVFRAA